MNFLQNTRIRLFTPDAMPVEAIPLHDRCKIIGRTEIEVTCIKEKCTDLKRGRQITTDKARHLEQLWQERKRRQPELLQGNPKKDFNNAQGSSKTEPSIIH